MIQHLPYDPPEPDPWPKIPQRRARKVPFPYPDPHDPEPSREIEPEEQLYFPDLDLASVPIPQAPPAAPGGPIHVRGDVKGPHRLFGPQPRYPQVARLARKEGIVMLEAIIDQRGVVTDVVVTRDAGMGLGAAAVETVRQWKYAPATLNGKPVGVYFHLTVRFDLE